MDEKKLVQREMTETKQKKKKRFLERQISLCVRALAMLALAPLFSRCSDGRPQRRRTGILYDTYNACL